MNNRWFIKANGINQTLETTSNKYVDGSMNVFVSALLDPTSDITIYSTNGTQYSPTIPIQNSKFIITKYNRNGTRLWDISFGNIYNAYMSLDYNLFSNIYILVSFKYTGDPSYNLPNGGVISLTNQEEVYLLKYDNDGNYINSLKITTSPSWLGLNIDFSGNIYPSIYKYYESSPSFYDISGIYKTPSISSGNYNFFLRYDISYNATYLFYYKTEITTHMIQNNTNANYNYITCMINPEYNQIEFVDNSNNNFSYNLTSGYNTGVICQINNTGQHINHFELKNCDYVAINNVNNELFISAICNNTFFELYDISGGNSLLYIDNLTGLNLFLIKLDINNNIIWYRRTNTPSASFFQHYSPHLENNNYDVFYQSLYFEDCSGIAIYDEFDNIIVNYNSSFTGSFVKRYNLDNGTIDWKITYNSEIDEFNNVIGESVYRTNNIFVPVVTDTSYTIIDASNEIFTTDNQAIQSYLLYQFDNSGNGYYNYDSGGVGDPHIRTIFGEKYLLPNWNFVNLLTIDNKIQINGKCEFLDKNMIKRMHRYKRDGSIRKLSLNKKNDRYAYKYTYFNRLEILMENFRMEIAVDQTEVVENNFPTNIINYSIYEPEFGLYSQYHELQYPKHNAKEIKLNIPKFDLEIFIKSDIYWDERNEIRFRMKAIDISRIKGAFVKNSAENKLENFTPLQGSDSIYV